MNLRITTFAETDRETWEALVARIPEATCNTSWSLLHYLSLLPRVREHRSFVAFLEGNIPAALCVLALSEGQDGQLELSMNGGPLDVPAFAPCSPSMRRKLSDEIFEHIFDYGRSKDACRLLMKREPLTAEDTRLGVARSANLFEPLRYGLAYRVDNTLLMPLDESEETLEANVSKYQRKHIRHARRAGLEVRGFHPAGNMAGLERAMADFQQTHFLAAGRATRPQATWDAMAGAVCAGNAALYGAYHDDIPVSFLLCSEFHRLATGWSQANVPEFEQQYSPRHLLEWEAILDYKRRGFRFYDVGERFFGPQAGHTPTEKELSISVFKERFGGVLHPRIHWSGDLGRG